MCIQSLVLDRMAYQSNYDNPHKPPKIPIARIVGGGEQEDPSLCCCCSCTSKKLLLIHRIGGYPTSSLLKYKAIFTRVFELQKSFAQFMSKASLISVSAYNPCNPQNTVLRKLAWNRMALAIQNTTGCSTCNARITYSICSRLLYKLSRTCIQYFNIHT